jgi:hypothetical protein
MTTRLTTRIVNFLRPFTLNEVDGERPAGAYVVETEEEKRNFVFFSRYRRVSTVMHRSDLHAAGSLIRFLTIDPIELESALAREGQIAAQFE